MTKTKNIQKLLAANRSEIAIRVFRAANELGLRTVGDLLMYLPRDRREARAVAELVAGETATGVVQVVVNDVEAVRQQLAGRGVETSAVDVQPWGRFIYFSDPDGNTWSVQQIVPRE